MRERLVRLVAEPGNNRNPAETVHQQRVMGVADDARELLLEDAVQKGNDPVLIHLAHGFSPALCYKEPTNAAAFGSLVRRGDAAVLLRYRPGNGRPRASEGRW